MTLATIEINPSKEAVRSIIWLHGLGADGHDFTPIIGQLGIQETLQIRFIFPHAPIMPVTLNGGRSMRAWFDIHGIAMTARIDIDGIERSRNAIEMLIQQEKDKGISSKNIMLAGFSQGAVMALLTGLQHEEALGGVIALSGYLPNADTNLQHAASVNQQCPIFLAHGINDPIVPYPLGLETCEALLRAGRPVSWHSYHMPHSVCDEEIKDIRKWVENISYP